MANKPTKLDPLPVNARTTLYLIVQSAHYLIQRQISPGLVKALSDIKTVAHLVEKRDDIWALLEAQLKVWIALTFFSTPTYLLFCIGYKSSIVLSLFLVC